MFKDTTRAESVYTSAVRGGLQALVKFLTKKKKKDKKLWIINSDHVYNRKKQAVNCLSFKPVFPTTDLTC
jgi:hypothetical protein